MAQDTFRASVELHSTVDTFESWPTHLVAVVLSEFLGEAAGGDDNVVQGAHQAHHWRQESRDPDLPGLDRPVGLVPPLAETHPRVVRALEPVICGRVGLRLARTDPSPIDLQEEARPLIRGAADEAKADFGHAPLPRPILVEPARELLEELPRVEPDHRFTRRVPSKWKGKR